MRIQPLSQRKIWVKSQILNNGRVLIVLMQIANMESWNILAGFRRIFKPISANYLWHVNTWNIFQTLSKLSRQWTMLIERGRKRWERFQRVQKPQWTVQSTKRCKWDKFSVQICTIKVLHLFSMCYFIRNFNLWNLLDIFSNKQWYHCRRCQSSKSLYVSYSESVT